MSGLGPQSTQTNLGSSTNPVPEWYMPHFDILQRQQHHQQNYGSHMNHPTSQGPYVRPTVQSTTRVRQHPSASCTVSTRPGQSTHSSEALFPSVPQHTSSQEFHNQQFSAQALKQRQRARMPPFQPFVGPHSGTEDMLIGARIVEQQFYRTPDLMQASQPNLAKNLQQNDHPIQRVGVSSLHNPPDIPHLTQTLAGTNATAQELSTTYSSQQYTFVTTPDLESQQHIYDNELLHQRNQSNLRRSRTVTNNSGNRTQQNPVYNVQQPFQTEQHLHYLNPQPSGAQKARTIPNYPQTSVDMSVYAHVPMNVPANSEGLVNLSLYSQVNSQASSKMPVHTQGSRPVSCQPPQQQQQQQKGIGVQQQFYNNFFPFSRSTQDMAAAELNVHRVMAGYARSQIRQRNSERSERTTREDLSKIRSVFAVPQSSEQANDRSVLQRWYAEPSSTVLEEPPTLEPAVLPMSTDNGDVSQNCNQNGQNQHSKDSTENRSANGEENVLGFTLTPSVSNENVIEYKVLDLLKCFEIEQRNKIKTSKDDKNPSNRIVSEQQESDVGMEQTGSDFLIVPSLINTSVDEIADRQPTCPSTSVEKVIEVTAANISPAKSEDTMPSPDLQNTSKGTKRKASNEQITPEKSRKVEEQVQSEQKTIFGPEGQERGMGQRRGRGGRGRGRGRGKAEKGVGMTSSFKMLVDSSLWGGSRGRGRGRKRGIGRGATTSAKQPLDNSLKGFSGGHGRGGKTGLGRGAATSIKHTLDGSKRGSARGRGRARKTGIGQRRGRGKMASLHRTLDSVLMQEDPDVDALTAHLNTYTEDALTKETISLKSLRHCLNKMKGKLKVPEILKENKENSDGEKCENTYRGDEREYALNKSHTATDTEIPENISSFQDGSDTAYDLNKENVGIRDIGRSDDSNFTVGATSNKCESASGLNKNSVVGWTVHIENVSDDNGVTESISCQNAGSSGTAKVSCDMNVEVIGGSDEKMRSDVEENCSKQTDENKCDGSENDDHIKQEVIDGGTVDGTEITEPAGLIVKLPNLVPKGKERKEKVKTDTDTKSAPKMSHTFDEAHKAAIVKFHDKTVLLLSTEKGNFFLMKELLKRCFCKDIVDKEERLKTKQKTLLIKEKQLNIPFKAMDMIFHSFVKNYFRKRKISPTLHSEVSVISEEDANRLFHVIYGDKYCTNGCIVTDAWNKVKTVQQTDRSCNVTDTSASTSTHQGIVKDSCQLNSETVVGSSSNLENKTVSKHKNDQNMDVKENTNDRNIFQLISLETCKLPMVNMLSKKQEGEDDKGYDSDATYVYQEEEDDRCVDELNDSKKDSDTKDGSGNTGNSASVTIDKDSTETFEVYKEDEFVGVFKVNSPNQVESDNNSKTMDEHRNRKVEPCKAEAEGVKSDSCIDLTQSIEDAIIDLTEAMDDDSADCQEDKGIAQEDYNKINVAYENVDKGNEEEKMKKNKSNNKIHCSQTQESSQVGTSVAENMEDDVMIEGNTEVIITEKHAFELLPNDQNTNSNEAGEHNSLKINKKFQTDTNHSSSSNITESDDECSSIKVTHLLQDHVIDDDDVVEIQINVESKPKTIDTVATIQKAKEQNVNTVAGEVTSNKHSQTMAIGPTNGEATMDDSTVCNSVSEADAVKNPSSTIHKEVQDSKPDDGKSSEIQIPMLKENLSSSITLQNDIIDKHVNERGKDAELETKTTSEERIDINISATDTQKENHVILDNKSSETQTPMVRENKSSSVTIQKDSIDKPENERGKDAELETKATNEERTNMNISAADTQKDKFVFLDDTTIIQSTEFISKAEETVQGFIYKANSVRKDEKCREMVSDLYRELDDISKPVIEWSLRFVNMYKKSFEMAKDDSMLRDLEEVERTYTDWNGKQ